MVEKLGKADSGVGRVAVCIIGGVVHMPRLKDINAGVDEIKCVCAESRRNGIGHRVAPALFFAVSALELVYLACRVENFLLTGVKRMAGRANFDGEVSTDGRARNKCVAAAAGNVDFFVFWVDFSFHHWPLVQSCRIRWMRACQF